jgi:hypothetical protein
MAAFCEIPRKTPRSIADGKELVRMKADVTVAAGRYSGIS